MFEKLFQKPWNSCFTCIETAVSYAMKGSFQRLKTAVPEALTPLFYRRWNVKHLRLLARVQSFMLESPESHIFWRSRNRTQGLIYKYVGVEAVVGLIYQMWLSRSRNRIYKLPQMGDLVPDTGSYLVMLWSWDRSRERFCLMNKQNTFWWSIFT